MASHPQVLGFNVEMQFCNAMSLFLKERGFATRTVVDGVRVRAEPPFEAIGVLRRYTVWASSMTGMWCVRLDPRYAVMTEDMPPKEIDIPFAAPDSMEQVAAFMLETQSD